MQKLALVALFCLLGSPLVAQDKGTIDKLNDAFETAFNKGDAATVANMYTDDAYLLPRKLIWSAAAMESSSSGKPRVSRSET